ncbi:MAG TPA: hypothetical protein VF789_10925 [Thermoanaerobaculia bacterium]
MKTLLSSTLKGLLILGFAMTALPCAAQEVKPVQDEIRPEPASDPNRSRIIEALNRGNLAEAEKLFSQFSNAPGKAAAQSIKSFEEIAACGFYPQETRLECIVNIKSTGGYGGAPTGRATHEFVSFWVDWDCSGSYSADEAVGLGIVHMHDEVAGAPPVWQYAVYRDIDPPGSLSDKCFMRTGPGGNPVMTKTRTLTLNARAILSWFAPVTSFNSVPVWGNVVNFRIRLDPIR